VFPGYCRIGLVTVFVLHRLGTRPGAPMYAACAAFAVLIGLWRLDVGLASVLAAVATVLAMKGAAREDRIRLVPLVAFGILAGAVVAAVVYSIGRWRDIDLAVLFHDLRAIVASNQAHGFAEVARAYNEVFYWHHFLIPAAVLTLLVVLVVRSWRRLGPGEQPWFTFVTLVFMSVYYFANAPRGLVRHGFMEPGNVLLTSFGVAVLSFAAYWVRGVPRAVPGFLGFVAVSSTLAFAFPLEDPETQVVNPTWTRFERLTARMRNFPWVEPAEQRIDRSPFRASFEETHLAALRAFVGANLSRDETFVDVSRNPMLYFYLRRRSPHYANHVLLLHDDYQQRRFIEEVEAGNAPLVLMPGEQDLCRSLGVIDHGATKDGVPIELTQYRMFEYFFREYVPLAMVQRWPVWARKDWAQPAVPAAVDIETKFTWRAGAAAPLDLSAAAGLELRDDRLYWLRVRYRAPGPVTADVHWSIEREARPAAGERRWRLPAAAAAHERFLVMPWAGTAGTLDALDVGFGGEGFEPLEVDLVEADAPAYLDVWTRARAVRTWQVKKLPYLWGTFDPLAAPDRETQRLLLESGPAPDDVGLRLAAHDDGFWRNGISLRRAAIRLAEPRPAAMQPGDVIVFAGAGKRRITGFQEMRDDTVFVDGDALDPDADGSPQVAVWRPLAKGRRYVPQGNRFLIAFDPVGLSKASGNYLMLDLTNETGEVVHAWIDYGVDVGTRGQFKFEVDAARERRTYAFRLSAQPPWNLLDCHWVALYVIDGALLIDRAAIVAGD
jgi:hypothetical protein